MVVEDRWGEGWYTDATETYSIVADTLLDEDGYGIFHLGPHQPTAVRESYFTVTGPVQDLHAGIRVFIRHADASLTEITPATPVAVATLPGADWTSAIVSGTWDCPSTSLVPTDRIFIRGYIRRGVGDWQHVGPYRPKWATEVLGAVSLDPATWTVYYWLYISVVDAAKRRYQLWWGRTDRYVKIENFSWTPAPPVVVPYGYGDGLVCVQVGG